MLTGAHFRQHLNDRAAPSTSRGGHPRRLLRGTRLRGVELIDVDIYGELQNVIVNGVDIAPLVEAELNRRMPERAKMRPDDPDGFRAAWADPGAAVGGHRRPGADAARKPCCTERRRRVVVHPDAAAPQLRHRRLGGPDGPRQPVAVAPAGPAVGRGPRLGRHPVGPRRAPTLDEVLAVRQRAPGDGPPGAWRRSPTTQLAADGDQSRTRLARSGRLPGQAVSAHRAQRGMGTPALRRT